MVDPTDKNKLLNKSKDAVKSFDNKAKNQKIAGVDAKHKYKSFDAHEK